MVDDDKLLDLVKFTAGMLEKFGMPMRTFTNDEILKNKYKFLKRPRSYKRFITVTLALFGDKEGIVHESPNAH